MRKITLLLAAFILVTSCAIKQTKSMLTSGDYEGALQMATQGLQGNKNAKGKQDYVLILEEAFAKAKERDISNINLWFKDANPSNLEKIYQTYVDLNSRQENIRPLLPLRIIKENREAKFAFDDYSDQIVSSKKALSKYLYDNSKGLLGTKNKDNYRRAYDDLVYLNSLDPDYKDVRKLTEEALFKGTDFVSVYTKNETNLAIPIRLENDLLDFSTMGLNNKWTVYHSNRQQGIDYDYGVIVNFRQINISPEQVKEKEFNNEKQIKIGMKKLLDNRGHVVNDSLGNPIMVEDLRIVKAKILETRQLKTCQVTAKIDYINFKTNQLLQTFPVTSQFLFENVYAKIKGDKRAVDKEYYDNFNRTRVPFPSNEQMVFDTGEDLKLKLKEILVRNRF
ncbi:MAG: hypothetical protein PSV16_04055 [Flavobacterium sp.]|nr:hypothetical protein [Flavobacterium sp.]